MHESGPREPPAAETTIAVLIGASEYPRKPAWANPVLRASAHAFRDYVRSETGLALTPGQVLDLFDDGADPNAQLLRIGDFLAANARSSRDLVLYYVGHGGFHQDEYYLGVQCTQHDREFITTIESRKLAQVIRKDFGRKRVYVILDSCFAASAASDWQSTEIDAAVRKLAQPLPRQGTAFLAAASKYDVTRAPRAERHTVFTGAVLEALQRGVDSGQQKISIYELYEEVRDLLQRREADVEGRPELHVPNQAEGDVSRLRLFPNAAYLRATAERARAERLAAAERMANALQARIDAPAPIQEPQATRPQSGAPAPVLRFLAPRARIEAPAPIQEPQATRPQIDARPADAELITRHPATRRWRMGAVAAALIAASTTIVALGGKGSDQATTRTVPLALADSGSSAGSGAASLAGSDGRAAPTTKTVSALIALEVLSHEDIATPRASEIATVLQNHTLVNAGDVIIWLVGNRPVQAEIARLTGEQKHIDEIDAAYQRRDAARITGDTDAMVAAQREIAALEKPQTNNQHQLERKRAELEEFLIRAPRSGSFVAIGAPGHRAVAKEVVARIEPQATPTATFIVTDVRLFAIHTTVEVTISGGARRVSCTITDVRPDHVKVVCPDPRLDEGTEVTLEPPAAPPRVKTVITANVESATVEILGTGQSGPSPFTAMLENGKSYEARVIAHGFASLVLDVKGGDPKLAVKLVPRPR